LTPEPEPEFHDEYRLDIHTNWRTSSDRYRQQANNGDLSSILYTELPEGTTFEVEEATSDDRKMTLLIIGQDLEAQQLVFLWPAREDVKKYVLTKYCRQAGAFVPATIHAYNSTARNPLDRVVTLEMKQKKIYDAISISRYIKRWVQYAVRVNPVEADVPAPSVESGILESFL
jgi:hypothetical protein